MFHANPEALREFVLDSRPVSKQDKRAARVVVVWDFNDDDVFLAELRRLDIVNPTLILAVCHPLGGGPYGPPYEVTQLAAIPLHKRHRALTFSQPGENEVRAYIIDGNSKSGKEAISNLKRYPNSLFGYSGKLSYSYEDTVLPLPVQLDVPVEAEGQYAKDPPRWMNDFVRNFFGNKPFDECDFRRRAIISFLVYAPLLLVSWPLRLVCAIVALLFGLRNIPWSGLNPFNVRDIPWPHGEINSWYIHKPNGNLLPIWPSGLLCNPVVVVLMGALAYVLRAHKPTWDGYFHFMIGYVVAQFVAAVFFAILVGICYLIAFLWEQLFDRPSQRVAAADARRQHHQAELDRRYARLREQSPVDELTTHIYLTGVRVKSLVCKPYRR